MLEYFAYRKFKKNKSEKEARELARQEVEEHERITGKRVATPEPILDEDDEAFFARLLESSDDVESRPPLPARTSELSTQTKVKEKEKRSHNPITLLLNRNKNKDTQLVPANPQKDPAPVAPVDEVQRERDDLSQVLDDLSLGASRNNKAFALSAENNDLVRKFTLVLKDLVNGVPTAVDDLKNLIDDRDGTIKRNYDKLPSSMKKMVAQMPDKVQKNMGPELMAAAAKSQGMKLDPQDKNATLGDTAKSIFMPKNLNDLITKPGAIIGMLKGIVSFLKLRWPALIGLNVVWSVAIFLLLLVLWYCHKRGRETRIERERSQHSVDGVDDADRIEELPDDLMLSGPPSRASSYRSGRRRRSVDSRDEYEYARPSRRRSPSSDYERERPRRQRSYR